ncbi:hypothetical protein BDW62DRAFT_204100 [Aspergillus aurantiobrunneus]
MATYPVSVALFRPDRETVLRLGTYYGYNALTEQPRLKDLAIRLGPHRNTELIRMILDTIKRKTNFFRTSYPQTAKAAFSLLNLPSELQIRVLECTGLTASQPLTLQSSHHRFVLRDCFWSACGANPPSSEADLDIYRPFVLAALGYAMHRRPPQIIYTLPKPWHEQQPEVWLNLPDPQILHPGPEYDPPEYALPQDTPSTPQASRFLSGFPEYSRPRLRHIHWRFPALHHQSFRVDYKGMRTDWRNTARFIRKATPPGMLTLEIDLCPNGLESDVPEPPQKIALTRAQEFLADVKNGVVPVDSHDKALRIAFIYMDEGLWQDNGVLECRREAAPTRVVIRRGRVLRFNRTLDIFYLVQIGASINRSDQMDGDFPSPDDFDTFYTTHHALLNPSAWRSYYSETFLNQPTIARFYCLPELQDLPDTDFSLEQPRKRPHPGGGPLLPLESFTELALSMLKTTITRLRAVYPSVPPYSKTQARFWLEYMNLGSPAAKAVSRESWEPNTCGILAAQGAYDVYAWEEKYSAQVWEASWERRGVVEPDVEDDVWKTEVVWCGWLDGGIGAEAWWRGWEREVGGEEEVEFLAAVAVEETVGVDLDKLDFAVRSHVLLGVMQAAVKEGQKRQVFLEELEGGMVQSKRIREDTAGVWLREALGVVEPYIRIWEGVWPDTEEWAEVLRRMLVDNGQLFAKWKVSPHWSSISSWVRGSWSSRLASLRIFRAEVDDFLHIPSTRSL